MELEISRNKQQEYAFYIIYQMLFLQRMEKEFNIIEIIEENLECSYDDAPLFIKDVVVQVAKHSNEIKDMIIPHLKNWEYERINLLVISILMLAIGEYKFVGDVDKAVIINVAVDLCKKFAGEKDYRFVNAILDKIL